MHLEAQAITATAARLDANFMLAVGLILQCKGKVVLSGVGKSGHIGRKIASTFASTGTPAFFMHPAEASHGDLGMISETDILLALSHSGESSETINILQPIKRLGVKIIAITGHPDSSIAKMADMHLNAEITREACPLGLAPTCSTTVTLSLGDALAVCVFSQRGFSTEDFARSHPGGSLGRRTTLRVKDIMRIGVTIPRVSATTNLASTLFEITQKGLGLTAVIDDQQQIIGVFSDGDLRRALARPIDFKKTTVGEVMKHTPYTIAPDAIALDAVQMMETHKISALLVKDKQGALIGVLNMHDLLKAKVV